MYVSRLTFHTLPGKTQEVEKKLITLRDWVAEAGGLSRRVMGHWEHPIWFLSKRWRTQMR